MNIFEEISLKIPDSGDEPVKAQRAGLEAYIADLSNKYHIKFEDLKYAYIFFLGGRTYGLKESEKTIIELQKSLDELRQSDQ